VRANENKIMKADALLKMILRQFRNEYKSLFQEEHSPKIYHHWEPSIKRA